MSHSVKASGRVRAKPWRSISAGAMKVRHAQRGHHSGRPCCTGRTGRTEEIRDEEVKKKKKNAAAQLLGARRWYGVSREDRVKFAHWAAAQGSGRPRRMDVPRCPCGNMTLKAATIRGGKRGTSKGHESGCTFYMAPPEAAALPKEIA